MIGDRRSAIGCRLSAAGSLRSRRGRPAFSLLELQVAFVVFGIALTGLCPLVVMQTRHVKNLEARLNPQTVYYLVPSSDLWTAKLGAAATVTSQFVAPTPSTPLTPVNQVQILSLDKSLTSEIVTAHVSVGP
jgi:hypothetical protein